MRRLRTMSSRRLAGLLAALAALVAGGAVAQAALGGSAEPPAPKALDRAVLDALNAPAVEGLSARVTFTNGLLPAGTLPEGGGSALATGAEGRLWLADDGRFRVELQSGAGDAQVGWDGKELTLYDASGSTAYVVPAPRGAAHEPQAAGEPTLAGVRRALERLARTWDVSGARATTTADEPSYTVRIAPRDDGGLLGAAELAWDAARGVPLRAAVYAQGQEAPVLELEATDIAYGPVGADQLETPVPAGTEVVRVEPAAGAPREDAVRPERARGVDAVRAALDFPLAAPDALAGLPRRSVHLVDAGGDAGALAVYGEGLGAIAVLQRAASPEAQTGAPGGGVELPRVNVDGATGTELATPLGTLLTFEDAGVAYTVAGSVPPVAAENAARDLK